MKTITEKDAHALHQTLLDAIHIVGQFACDARRFEHMHHLVHDKTISAWYGRAGAEATDVARRLRHARAMLADRPSVPQIPTQRRPAARS